MDLPISSSPLSQLQILVMCDRRLISGDRRDWSRMLDDAKRAEDVSQEQSFKIEDGLTAKKARGHHVGPTPRGFTRVDGIDQPDPEALKWIEDRIFSPYAAGNTSARLIADATGLKRSNVEQMLKAEYYRLHFPDLWDTVAEIRAERTHGGGPRRRDRFDPLSGRLRCSDCQGTIRAYGSGGTNRYPQRYHRCPQPRQQIVWHERTFLEPLYAALGGIHLTRRGLSTLRRALSAPPAPQPPSTFATRKRLAERYTMGGIDLDTLQTSITALNKQDAASPAPRPRITLEQATHYLEDFSTTWALAIPEDRQRLLAATVKSAEFRDAILTRVELADEAMQYGMTLFLPDTVQTLARGARARRTGFEPATFGSGGRRSIH